MQSEIFIALISLIGTFFGTFSGIKLMSYRIEQLEKKVEAHNQVITRTYELEKKESIQDEEIKVINHRISDLEAKP